MFRYRTVPIGEIALRNQAEKWETRVIGELRSDSGTLPATNRAPQLVATSILSVAVCLSADAAFGHGGGVAADSCRAQIGSSWVHFAAYQPELTGAKEFCDTIPELGAATLVFDYENRALRNTMVTFEITKEPGGVRVAYEPPAAYPNGTASTRVQFTESGRYLAHVTLTKGTERLDAHIPFTVAMTSAKSFLGSIAVWSVFSASVCYILYLAAPAYRKHRAHSDKFSAEKKYVTNP